MHEKRHVVVQIWESDAILCAHRLPNDNLVNVVELIPVIVAEIVVLDQWLELGTTWDGHVKRLRREETLGIEKVEEIIVDEIGEQLICQTVKSCHLRQCQVPFTERGAIDVSGKDSCELRGDI